MTITYLVECKVEFDMSEYIQGMLDKLPPDMEGLAATPVADHYLK
jgi:hypothetical protein